MDVHSGCTWHSYLHNTLIYANLTDIGWSEWHMPYSRCLQIHYIYLKSVPLKALLRRVPTSKVVSSVLFLHFWTTICSSQHCQLKFTVSQSGMLFFSVNFALRFWYLIFDEASWPLFNFKFHYSCTSNKKWNICCTCEKVLGHCLCIEPKRVSGGKWIYTCSFLEVVSHFEISVGVCQGAPFTWSSP